MAPGEDKTRTDPGGGRCRRLLYGIAIQMFYDDHNPPHLHARYGRARALIRLADGEIIAGELPPLARRIVKGWTLARRVELEENWRRSQAHEALEKVAGPDADE